ncbi:hypothetical protein NVP2275O_455 [Vibrio phage 2.275.O._10N.286.54.E11]|nr:hypothetical protein NVP2275O_455 [Vibrio phage 2.275.O._10N.286.54.E11]
MDFRETRMLLESIEAMGNTESDALSNAFSLEGIGELIEYTFRDADTPQELQRGIIGMSTELHNSMKAGDYSIANDMGIKQPEDIKQFLIFAKEVASNPEQFFAVYQNTLNPTGVQGDV